MKNVVNKCFKKLEKGYNSVKKKGHKKVYKDLQRVTKGSMGNIFLKKKKGRQSKKGKKG